MNVDEATAYVAGRCEGPGSRIEGFTATLQRPEAARASATWPDARSEYRR